MRARAAVGLIVAGLLLASCAPDDRQDAAASPNAAASPTGGITGCRSGGRPAAGHIGAHRAAHAARCRPDHRRGSGGDRVARRVRGRSAGRRPGPRTRRCRRGPVVHRRQGDLREPMARGPACGEPIGQHRRDRGARLRALVGTDRRHRIALGAVAPAGRAVRPGTAVDAAVRRVAAAGALVGYSYWVQSATEPEGFAGSNDHWHQHQGLCIVNGWADRERRQAPMRAPARSSPAAISGCCTPGRWPATRTPTASSRRSTASCAHRSSARRTSPGAPSRRRSEPSRQRSRTMLFREVVVGVERGELRELGDHVVRRVEQEPAVGLEQHRRVVVAVAGGDDAVAERVERLDRAALLVGLAEAVVDDAVVRRRRGGGTGSPASRAGASAGGRTARTCPTG